jgi:uncharacterized protein
MSDSQSPVYRTTGWRQMKFFLTKQLSSFFVRGTGTSILAAAIIAAPAAYAEFSDSYKFLKAVKEQDGTVAEQLISVAGSGAVLINTRDDTSGEGALHIIVNRRDSTWLGYLLQKGADPNIADKNKVTPLMLSTQLNYAEGVDWLIRYKANVDQTNRSGETALILAVNLNYKEMVRVLLKAGANPNKRDSITGSSARDYASRDRRKSDILALIEANDKKPADSNTVSKDLDFTGIK